MLYGSGAQGAFGRAGFGTPRSTNLRTAATHLFSRKSVMAPFYGVLNIFKVTPSPPDTDPASPYESDSNKLKEAAEQALNHYFPSTADIKSASRSPSTLFTIDSQAKTESLLVYLVETLASVDVMVHQLVDHLDGDSRYALLGISNSIMVAEITANRMLDQMDPPE